MGNTGEDVDTPSPMKIEKKKKKNKNITNDGDGDGDGDGNTHLNEKLHEHTKKKKKTSESNEDVEENGDIKQKKRKREKENDDDPKVNKDKKKKRELESNEDVDLQKKKKKKKKKYSSEKTQTKENEHSQEDDPKLVKHKKKKKKSKSNEDGGDDSNNLEDNGDLKKNAKKKKDSSENSQKKKTKKVTFSSDVEIFPPSKTKKKEKPKTDDNLVCGKRFTPEEDEIVKQAVEAYIVSNNLGDDGLKMILNCKSHKGMSKCWQEIATCIPYRPYTAVYYRAHILFEQSEHRQWSPEEINFLKESYKKHGNKWKMIAEELGKHRFHVKDTWRRIKLDNLKTGKWTQDEYQNLYDMVNLDLQMKIIGEGQEKHSKHGMLRDNIPWTSISEKLSTRSDATCCIKWYEQLTSSLVAEKKWADADDYWLIGRLYEIDAACVEDVDWDDLLEHRSGEICRKRWDQMVVRIGEHRSKTFGEQVEILAKRYRPELAEARQTWDDKPVVP
ncbi:hypothetical protein LXL04_037645 [Taraxacum kok-saghyz]